MNESVKQGDLVIRKSYGGDITFRVETLFQQIAVIKGTDYRLLADSPVDDLVSIPKPTITRRLEQEHIKMLSSVEMLERHRKEQHARRRAEYQFQDMLNSLSYFEMPGKVLHLDGDAAYLQKSMVMYNQLHVPAEGHYVYEGNMADTLYPLLPRIQPNIIVITGHDGVLKNRQSQDLYDLQNYKNSQNFVDAVQVARQYERHLDMLTIIAGACQSHFEALLQAGANFASSPGRIMIHALDPVYIAVRAAHTSIRDMIHIEDIMSQMISGMDGVGGIETRGSHRLGMPKWKDLSSLDVTPLII